jgi:hypothetical protein
VRREIHLDGGDISILKGLGLGGAPVHGKQLLDRVSEMETAEFLDTLDGLITVGYVLSSKVNVLKMEDVEHSYFRVNPSYARELRDALQEGRRHEDDHRRRRRRSSAG